jgi:hypothetical protein
MLTMKAFAIIATAFFALPLVSDAQIGIYPDVSAPVIESIVGEGPNGEVVPGGAMIFYGKNFLDNNILTFTGGIIVKEVSFDHKSMTIAAPDLQPGSNTVTLTDEQGNALSAPFKFIVRARTQPITPSVPFGTGPTEVKGKSTVTPSATSVPAAAEKSSATSTVKSENRGIFIRVWAWFHRLFR